MKMKDLCSKMLSLNLSILMMLLIVLNGLAVFTLASDYEEDLGKITYYGNNPDTPDLNDCYIQELTAPAKVKSKNLFNYNGYSFIGWNTKADGSGTWYPSEEFITEPLGNVNLYAQWIVTPENYLCYNAKGTYVLGGKSFEYITLDSFPSEVTLKPMADTTAYTYIGWSTVPSHWEGTEETDISYSPNEKITVSQNTTLYAWYMQIQNVYYPYVKAIYHSNGGANEAGSTVKIDSVSYSDLSLYNSDAFSQEGKFLIGWNTKPDGTGTQYSVGEALNSGTYNKKTLRLYAQWIVPDVFAKGSVLQCCYNNKNVIADIEMDCVYGNCTAIIALYDTNNRLINMSTKIISTNTKQFTISCPCDENYADYKVKILFWDNLNTLNPLGNPIQTLISDLNITSK